MLSRLSERFFKTEEKKKDEVKLDLQELLLQIKNLNDSDKQVIKKALEEDTEMEVVQANQEVVPVALGPSYEYTESGYKRRTTVD